MLCYAMPCYAMLRHAVNCLTMLCCAGAVVASLLPLPSANMLGVDSAGADASEAESHSNSSSDMQAGQDDNNTARYCLLLIDD